MNKYMRERLKLKDKKNKSIKYLSSKKNNGVSIQTIAFKSKIKRLK